MAGPWHTGQYFHMDVRTGECLLQETVKSDLLSKEDLWKYKTLVDEAYQEELSSFVKEKIFKLVWAQEATARAIDAVWVRRWKRDSSYRRI